MSDRQEAERWFDSGGELKKLILSVAYSVAHGQEDYAVKARNSLTGQPHPVQAIVIFETVCLGFPMSLSKAALYLLRPSGIVSKHYITTGNDGTANISDDALKEENREEAKKLIDQMVGGIGKPLTVGISQKISSEIFVLTPH